MSSAGLVTFVLGEREYATPLAYAGGGEPTGASRAISSKPGVMRTSTWPSTG